MTSRRHRFVSVSMVATIILLASCRWNIWGESGAANVEQRGLAYTSARVAPHPRLLFGVDDVETIQGRASTTHWEIWMPIREFVGEQMNSSPPVQSPPDGDLDTYRNFGNQLIPYAFACLVTGGVDDCRLAQTYLLAYADWEQWGENGYRSLGHAHMLLANALAYDWLYSRLSDAERRIVRNSLARWAQRMYEASSGPRHETWENWWRKSYLQNHYWTTHSALGVAGLALLGEDERAQTWVDHARTRMIHVQDLLNGIEDGSWHEGMLYQNYALTMSLPFWVNLRELQGRDIIPYLYLHNYAYWRLYNHLPGSDNFIFSHGDFDWAWGNSYSPQNILRFVAAQFENGYAEWVAQELVAAHGRFPNVWRTPWYVFEFFYYDADVEPRAPADLPVTRVFSDLEGVIWRTGWREDDLVFALKTGAYGGRYAFDTFTEEVYPWEAPCSETGCQFNIGHDHEDTNAFYLYRAGQWLAPETVGVNDHETEFHNVILIDGQGQVRPPSDERREPDVFRGTDGILAATTATPHFNVVVADATRRYQPRIGDLQSVTRAVLFVRPDYFVMLDRVAGAQPHSATWISHFGTQAELEGAWIRGVADDEQLLGVQVVAPDKFTATTGNDGQPYVHIEPNIAADDLRMIHLLWPGTTDSWTSRPRASVVATQDNAVMIRVTLHDGSDRTDDIILRTGDPGSLVNIGRYAFDGQVAVVGRTADGALDRLFLDSGTRLRDQLLEQDLVQIYANIAASAQASIRDAVHALEAVYTTGHVHIFSVTDASITLNAPDVTGLTLNSVPWPFVRQGDQITLSSSALHLPLIQQGE